MEYKVIKRFKERYQNFKLYEIGDTYSFNNDERIAFLVREGFLTLTTTIEAVQKEIKHVGAGWYELPNGERVRGKEKALAMLGDTNA